LHTENAETSKTLSKVAAQTGECVLSELSNFFSNPEIQHLIFLDSLPRAIYARDNLTLGGMRAFLCGHHTTGLRWLNCCPV
jgi:hypothetical protein